MDLDRHIGSINFKCNICNAENNIPVGAFHRELAFCVNCGSNVRFRGIIHGLSVSLFGRSIPLTEFPKKVLRGIGMSDWANYAEPLSRHFDYTNTFYHCEPKLDLIDLSSLERWRGQDFVISSDVIEHVPPPGRFSSGWVWRKRS